MGKKRYESIAWLRVAAILMIVYDHIIAMRRSDWIVNKMIDRMINKPLYIIQNFGAFGVCIFLIISGFLIMNSNENKECIWKKMIRKIFEIYVSLLFAFVGFAICQFLVNKFVTTYWAQFTIKDWFESVTLLGYFTGNGDVINGTTWFLIPLFMFYLISIFVVKKMKKNFIGAILYTELLCAAFFAFLYLIKRYYGIDFYFTSFCTFIFIPITGVIIYGIYKERVKAWNGIGLLLINYILFVLAIHEFNINYYMSEPYIVSYIYAVVLFALCLLGEKNFKKNKLVDFIGKIGLPIYLLHMTWGSFLMSGLENKLPYIIAVFITLIIVVGIAWVHNRYIDENIKKL